MQKMTSMITVNDESSSAAIAEMHEESNDQITEAFNGGSHNTTLQRDHYSGTTQLLYDTNTIDQ